MIGKIIGGLLGFAAGGPLLAIIGVIIGHLFDRALKRTLHVSPEELQAIQTSFFNTLFMLLGHIAKADGRITETEIKLTESLMEKMGLSADHKREAIRLFKVGAEPIFNLDNVLRDFKYHSSRSPNLVQMLLVYLINLAMADGELHPNEEQILRQVAEKLGFSSFIFEQILRMIRAQNAFGDDEHFQRAQQAPRADEVTLAYEALGVSPTASDAEIKKSYRKLMSQYHPDKLIGQGMPEDMIKEATERSQEIQKAYDVIKKSRR
ncbi:MAG: co-chaperone DjlA [Cellvibrio sp.]|jgi:DnaJ-domain-containing proteins 1